MSDLGNKTIFAKNLNIQIALKGISRRQLAQNVGIPYTTLCDWCSAKRYPRIDKIEILADYFGIKKSELIEEQNNIPVSYKEENKINPNDIELTPKDERHIAKILEDLLSDVSTGQTFAAHGGTVDDKVELELLKKSLEEAARYAKRMAKAKFTPKKYRK